MERVLPRIKICHYAGPIKPWTDPDLELADRYFRLRIEAETRAAPEDPPEFTLAPGKLTRSIGAPEEGTSAEEFAERISAYVRSFDADMKAFIAARGE